MRVFLTAAAVIIGLANAILYSVLGESPWGGPFVWRFEPDSLFVINVLSAILTGSLVPGLLFQLVGRGLRGGFLARYGFMVAAICAGGAILGILLDNSVALFDARETIPQGLAGIMFALAFPAVLGGILGAVEGVILALPLAALLGLFGDRMSARADSQP